MMTAREEPPKTEPPDVDAYLMMSALQHYLYCARQAALIHVEGVWQDNPLTVEGTHLHQNLDVAALKMRDDMRLVTAMPLVSHELRLVGRADLVAIDPDGQPQPVETKHGREGPGEANRVQLCAQAMALEEMMAVTIASGWLYYHGLRRRKEVVFDETLRATTRNTSAALHRMVAAAHTPAPVADGRCPNCSLIQLCLPWLAKAGSVYDYLNTD